MSLPQSMQLYEVAPLPSKDPISTTFMLKDLARSGLVPEDLEAYAIESVFGVGQYLIPYHTPQMWVRRIDTPTDKYRGPKNQTDLYIPPSYKNVGDTTLYLVEGEKKVVKFLKQFPGLQAIGIRGCRGYALNKTLHPTLIQALHGITTVKVVFDADIETNTNIQHAAHALALLLEPMHVQLEVLKPPLGKGADDWLIEDPYATLEDLVSVDLKQLEMGRKQVLDKAGIIIDDKGKFVKNEINASKILNVYYEGRILNDKRLGLIVDGKQMSDPDELEFDCVEFMQQEIAADYKLPTIRWGVQAVAKHNSTDLVKDLVTALKWDGIKRLDTWGSEYLHPTNGYTKAFANDWGRMLIRALTNRIIDPGCQVDFVFVLVGHQGTYKSTFLTDLGMFAGQSFYYALDSLPMGENAQSTIRIKLVNCHRSVIVDLAEGRVLDTTKNRVEDLKQFITQRTDNIQILYKNNTKTAERGFILAAATNRTDFLADHSGTRRFVTLDIGPNHVGKLPYEVKLQLMAEAVACPDYDWYTPRVTMEDVPEALKTANPYSNSVQEIMNTQHGKHDEVTDFIYELLDSDDVPTLRDEPRVKFLTCTIVTSLWNENHRSVTSNSLVARVLSSLITAPICPYHIERARKRPTQLTMNDNVKFKATNGLTNPKSDLNGYTFVSK